MLLALLAPRTLTLWDVHIYSIYRRFLFVVSYYLIFLTLSPLVQHVFNLVFTTRDLCGHLSFM